MTFVHRTRFLGWMRTTFAEPAQRLLRAGYELDDRTVDRDLSVLPHSRGMAQCHLHDLDRDLSVLPHCRSMTQ